MPNYSSSQRRRGFTNRELKWTLANRQPRLGSASMGDLAARFAERSVTCSADHHEVFEIIMSVVDDTFREHCRLARVKFGRVTILVDEPNWLYHMQSHWPVLLKEALERRSRRMTITGIDFRLGGQDLPFE